MVHKNVSLTYEVCCDSCNNSRNGPFWGHFSRPLATGGLFTPYVTTQYTMVCGVSSIVSVKFQCTKTKIEFIEIMEWKVSCVSPE